MGNKKGLDRLDPKRGTLCTARRRNGEKCLNYALRGTHVCRLHGGAAPQVKAAAQVRLLMAADRAAGELVTMMLDKTAPHSVRLAAARDLLDRAGLNARAGVDVAVTGELSLLERNLADVIVDYGDDTIDAEVVEPEPEPTPPERRALRPKRSKRSYRSPDHDSP